MPLHPGYSEATLHANIAMLEREGHTPGQASAIALEHGRAAYFKRHPQGLLPKHLKLPGGRRDRQAWNDYRRANGGCTCSETEEMYRARPSRRQKNPVLRHRYEVQYIDNWGGIERQGFDTAKEARTFANSKGNMVLEIFDTVQKKALFRAEQRRPNPVPESSRSAKRSRDARIAAASDLYTRFTGHDADKRVMVDKPEFPDTLLAIGDIDGILYTTVRDGQVERYIHKFKAKCRPLFCVSHDGKQIILLGGSYDFTERGIVDRT